MVIPQIPGDIKLRRCGYCLVKVGIQNMLEEEGMSDLKAYIVLQLLLLVFFWSVIAAERRLGRLCSYTSSSDRHWNTGQFFKAETSPCWLIETRIFLCHENIVFHILIAMSARPCSTVKEVILKIL